MDGRAERAPGAGFDSAAAQRLSASDAAPQSGGPPAEAVEVAELPEVAEAVEAPGAPQVPESSFDEELSGGTTTPVLNAGGYPPDEEALRGTRFEFGGRRPYSFTPPQVSHRASHRPLPGIGTVALGKVVRLTLYGAFVDFLGFRGLVHISQLMPGHRVERVEDVVQVGNEVVVRVIAVDPERRHINLTLIPSTTGSATQATVSTMSTVAPAGTAAGTTTPPATAPPSTPAAAGRSTSPGTATARTSAAPSMSSPAGGSASPSTHSIPPSTAVDAGLPAVSPPLGRSAGAPEARAISPVQLPVGAGANGTEGEAAAAPPAPSATAPVAQPRQVPPATSATPAVAQPAAAARVPSAAVPSPAGPRGAPAPQEAIPQEAIPQEAIPQKPAARGSAPPKPQPTMSRHASRAVRRDIVDPSHPMARLLATGGGAALPFAARSERGGSAGRQLTRDRSTAPPGAEPAAPAPAPGGAARSAPELRPIHVAEPDPEPQDDQPATLEALAARFGQRREKAAPAAQPATTGEAAAAKALRPARATRATGDRSRLEREKQAAILARLREEASRSS